jgi:hypothetical protein
MLIATLPLLPRYRFDITRHPLVDELRFNTIMPIDVGIPIALKQIQEIAGGKRLWLDLKTRQLRITRFAYLPYDFVELSHSISLSLPAKLYFKDCVADIESIVDGKKLILAERPFRTVGAGEPVNILEPSLKIEGFLTDQDHEYIEAAKSLGIHHYMLSFVEKSEDIEEMRAADPAASIIAKIESPRGLNFVRKEYERYYPDVRLMAARDDLYITMGEEKVEILEALRLILSRDPDAIVASRILTSLLERPEVSMGDLSDLHMLNLMGFKAFMLSDEICRIRDVFRAVMKTYESYHAYRGMVQ